MGLPLLPWCGTSATDMGFCRAAGRGPVACAFLQPGIPQLQQGACTGGPLLAFFGADWVPQVRAPAGAYAFLGQTVYSSHGEQVLTVLLALLELAHQWEPLQSH